MSKIAVLFAAMAALALCFVTLNPSPAEAGRGYRGPNVNVYVGPRYGYYRPRYYRPYRYGYGGGYPYAYYPYWRSYYWGGWY
jgi:hypothetical protein